jgi:release factor glutamine methyltransferase
MSHAQSEVGQTVEGARRALAARFKAAGIDSPELDARLLLGAATRLDLTGLIASAGRRLTAAQAGLVDAFATRRLSGEPVARILGEKEFWGLRLKLSPETLVPRPDTEVVVEHALDLLPAQASSSHTLRILDIGTGTGAILLALLSERRDAVGIGTDISDGALRTAKANAATLGHECRAAFVACNYAAALEAPFDLIVSNPPYVPSGEIDHLAVEVRLHEPSAALDGGLDGLAAYRALIPQAAQLLSDGGALVVEAGYGQSGPIAELMMAAGLALHETPKYDLAGIPRAIGARKMPR